MGYRGNCHSARPLSCVVLLTALAGFYCVVLCHGTRPSSAAAACPAASAAAACPAAGPRPSVQSALFMALLLNLLSATSDTSSVCPTCACILTEDLLPSWPQLCPTELLKGLTPVLPTQPTSGPEHTFVVWAPKMILCPGSEYSDWL